MFPSPTSQTPACHCLLKSPSDAIYILEAVRQGLLPRCSRRLTGNERGRIGPGSVWVWEEEETNMRRWTDGRRWGASRVGAGGFLIYREVEGSGRGRHSTSPSLSPPRNRNGADLNPHQVHPNFQPNMPPIQQPNGMVNAPSGSRSRHNGLVKQTYSTTMHTPDSGGMKKFHVVAYYSKNDQNEPHLLRPHEVPQLAGLQIPPGIWADYQDPRRGEDGTTPIPASTGVGRSVTATPYQQPPPSIVPSSAGQPGRSPYMHYPNSPYPPQPNQQPPPQMMHPGYPPPPPGYYGPPPGHEHMQPPPPGMYGIYYHPDPYFRYNTGAPPPPLSHQIGPTLGSPYEQQSRAPPSAVPTDRRTSIAPSKRSIPKHMHTSAPYPSQGSPSRQIGVIDPGLQGNPTNDRIHFLPQNMGSPYAQPPNGPRGSTPVVYEVGAADAWQREYQPRPEEMQQHHQHQQQQQHQHQHQQQHQQQQHHHHQRHDLREHVPEHQPLQQQPLQHQLAPVPPPAQPPMAIVHSRDPENDAAPSLEAPPASPSLQRSAAGYPSGGSRTPEPTPGEQRGHERVPSSSGGENGKQGSTGGDLTLPPIRSPQTKDGWKQRVSSEGGDMESKVKPEPIVESTSPTASVPQGEQAKSGDSGEVGENGKLIHGEDARQLRELSKMVTL